MKDETYWYVPVARYDATRAEERRYHRKRTMAETSPWCIDNFVGKFKYMFYPRTNTDDISFAVIETVYLVIYEDQDAALFRLAHSPLMGPMKHNGAGKSLYSY